MQKTVYSHSLLVNLLFTQQYLLHYYVILVQNYVEIGIKKLGILCQPKESPTTLKTNTYISIDNSTRLWNRHSGKRIFGIEVIYVLSVGYVFNP